MTADRDARDVVSFDDRRTALTQVLVGDLTSCVVDEADRHHVLKVMRARQNERVVAGDGKGGWRMLTVTNGELVTGTQQGHVNRARPRITLVVSPLKSDRTELVVQKSAELGIDCVVIVPMARTVVKSRSDKLAPTLLRLQRIATEAWAQSRGLWLTEVRLASQLSDVVDAQTWRADFSLSAVSPVDALGDSPESIMVAIGPEGGFDEAECLLVPRVIGLGASVLRAETAALSAAIQLSVARTQGESAARP
jgi:16S rRNA (uracil1498-N3)-methyltransferase